MPQIGFDISYQDNFVIYMPSYDVSQLGSTLLEDSQHISYSLSLSFSLSPTT
ncbi:hypothetical protein Syun_012214 [Stephania yunnanensis]|uniref:Uncharacterized protein n=1 Tax=Stephania yunnanensis TaxID=152371 RepID=A0AAP0JZU5_9MAGN